MYTTHHPTYGSSLNSMGDKNKNKHICLVPKNNNVKGSHDKMWPGDIISVFVAVALCYYCANDVIWFCYLPDTCHNVALWYVSCTLCPSCRGQNSNPFKYDKNVSYLCKLLWLFVHIPTQVACSWDKIIQPRFCDVKVEVTVWATGGISCDTLGSEIEI